VQPDYQHAEHQPLSKTARVAYNGRMRILVTGGAGFIGSHIADAYVKRGHLVSIVDNLSTGKRNNVNPRARFYRGDIKNRAFVDRVMRRERPEIVNHQAALASLRTAVRKPYELVDSNMNGTLNLLIASGTYHIKHFIFASSCSIFGHPKKLPSKEHEVPHPLSPYAYTKFANEGMIVFYAMWHKFAYTIFRYPNVYGPRQNPKGEAGVIPIFGELMKKGIRPKIFGDGSKTRDYIYVDDVASAHVKALARGKNHILHLGWGKEVSDQDIFDEIERVMRTGIKPVYAPFRPWEALHISLDPAHARKTLGWKPKVRLREGVKRTIASLS
jgi:UDP-glucose 4-epimerase